MQTYTQSDLFPYLPKTRKHPETKPKQNEKSQPMDGTMAAAFRKMADDGLVELGVYQRVAKFKNNSITRVDVFKPYVERPNNPNRTNNLLSQNGNDNTYNGYLSPATRRNIEQMLSVWLTSVELTEDLKKKAKEHNRSSVFPTFVTLTLPASQMHSDNTIKAEILNPFIKWLQGDETVVYQRGKRKGQQKGFGVKGYFWRAEAQKNTNVHFHIIIDRYVHWERIREKWNECCERLGYVSLYAYAQRARALDGFKLDLTKLEKDKEIFAEMAEKALAAKKVPESASPLFAQYLNAAIEYGMELNDAIYEQLAEEKQKKAFADGQACGWTNPNSTDIHSIQNLNSITAYVIKYIAKQPDVMPLAENQVVEFNENFGREMIHTYSEKEDWTGNIIREIEDVQENTPVFLDRRINGRLWGCADLLRGYKLQAGEEIQTDESGCTYVVSAMPDREDSNDMGVATKRPVATMKYFTREIGYYERIMSRNGQELKFYTADFTLTDPLAQKYLSDITNDIGQLTVDSISAKVGESFRRMNGEIIPFRPEKLGFDKKKKDKKTGKMVPIPVKHEEVLKKYSPDLHKHYVTYYRHIYNCIYQTQKAA